MGVVPHALPSASSDSHHHSLVGPTEFSMLLYMVKGVQADLKRMQPTQAGRRAPQLWDDSARPLPLTCWGCRSEGHMRQDCLRRRRVPLNTQGLWYFPPTVGPEPTPARSRFRWCSGRHGWSLLMQGGRHPRGLRYHKVYPNILPGHSTTGSQGCSMKLWRRNHPTLRGFPNNPSNLRKPPKVIKTRKRLSVRTPKNDSPRDGSHQELQTL